MSYLDNKIPRWKLLFCNLTVKWLVRGYGLNKMCFSLNTAAAREEFQRDEMAYCDKFGLTEEQKVAIQNRDVLGLLKLGGSIYYLALSLLACLDAEYARYWCDSNRQNG
ncbi:protocatechuate 3,4-dioxygenase [Vibrio sp. M60_M31a]